MSLSRLLLIAPNSRKYIEGENSEKVIIKTDPNSEVVLCFQLDERSSQDKIIAEQLGIPRNQKRCDGIIFYAKDDDPRRVICLVEMKSRNISNASEQIKATKKYMNDLLKLEATATSNYNCDEFRKQISDVKWIACLYHHGASPRNMSDFCKDLKNDGFVKTILLSRSKKELNIIQELENS